MYIVWWIHVADSRLCRRQYCADVRNRGLKSPRLFMFTSFRRFRSSFIVHNSQLIAHSSSLKMFFCLILLAGLARFAWVKQISIPIAVVLRCPFKISSTAVAVYLHRPMQYICSKKPMRWLDKVTALHSLTHRIVFVNASQCLNRCNESPLLCRWIAFHPAMNRLYFVKKAPFVFSLT